MNNSVLYERDGHVATTTYNRPEAPLAVRATREMAVRARHLPLTEAIRFGETMRRLVGSTADAAEGAAAARERRPPIWTGS